MSDDPFAWVDNLSYSGAFKVLRTIMLRHGIAPKTTPVLDGYTLKHLVRLLSKLEAHRALEGGTVER